MSALTRSIDAQIGLISVDAAVSVNSGLPWRFTLDSEVVYVTGGSPTLLSVDRGCDDTVRASHPKGTVLTPAPIPTSSGPGGSQTLAQTLALGNDTGGSPITDVSNGLTLLGGQIGIADTTAVPGTDANASAAATADADDAYVQSTAASNSGAANVTRSAVSGALGGGSGNASANTIANSVDGTASAVVFAVASGSGNADATTTATAAGGTASIGPTADSGGARVAVSSPAGSIPDLVAALTGLPQWHLFTVEFADFTDDGSGNFITPTVATIPARAILSGVGLRITQAFNATAEGALDLNLHAGVGNLIAWADARLVTGQPDGNTDFAPFIGLSGDLPSWPASFAKGFAWLAPTDTPVICQRFIAANDATTGSAVVYLFW